MDSGARSSGWIVVGCSDAESAHGAGLGRQEAPAARALLLRLKAEEARTTAGALVDPDSRRMMLQIANTYARLARHVADRPAAQERPLPKRASSPALSGAQSGD